MTNSKITIRPAGESDYTAINSLYQQSYQLLHKNLPESFKPTPIVALSRGDFLNEIESKEVLAIVAEVNKKVVGHLYAYVDDYAGDEVATGYHRVEIGELYGLPEMSRQGVGTMLMQEAEKWAKKLKITDLAVLTYDYNKEAISFYEANGYKQYSIKLEKKITKE